MRTFQYLRCLEIHLLESRGSRIYVPPPLRYLASEPKRAKSEAIGMKKKKRHVSAYNTRERDRDRNVRHLLCIPPERCEQGNSINYVSRMVNPKRSLPTGIDKVTVELVRIGFCGGALRGWIACSSSGGEMGRELSDASIVIKYIFL